MINLRVSVEEARADANCAVGERAKRAVDVRGAVQSRSDGHIECLVQDAAQFGRGKRFAAEAQRANAIHCVTMAEYLVVTDLVEPTPQTLGQGRFVRADAFKAMFENKAHAGGKP